MLSPTVEEATPTHLRDETRGNQRAEDEESSNLELLNLMREMRGKI